LQQLIQIRSIASDGIVASYRHHAHRQTRPSLAEFSDLLESEVRCFPKVFIVIDALDECSEKEGIKGFLPEVRKLPPNVHILVTSRRVTPIEHEFQNAACLEISASDEDIRSYAEARIEEHSQLLRHIKADLTLQRTILDSIIQKAKGMYVITA
jgi:hypothetical protein